MSVSGGPPVPVSLSGFSSQEIQARDLRKLARGGALNLAGTAVTAVANLGVPIVVTRSLGRDAAGSFFEATALFMILINAGCLGADTGLLRHIPRARALGRQREVKSLLGAALVPAGLVSLALTFLLIGFGRPIATLAVGRAPHQVGSFQHALQTLAPLLMVAVVYTILMTATRGFGPIKPLVLVEKLGRNSVQTGLVWASQVIVPSLTLLILAWILPYAAALLVIAVWIVRLYRQMMRSAPKALTPVRRFRTVAREFWAFTAPRAASRILAMALQRFDILLVGAIRGPQDAAIYAAASRFLAVGLMFVQAIQQVMAPSISGMLSRRDIGRATVMYRTTTAWLTAVSWPIYLVSAVFAPLLLKVFGGGYQRGAPVVVILCLSMLVATSCGPVDTMLLMGGRSSLSLMNTGLALATNVGLDLLLVPRWGIVGAALGWTTAIFVNNLLPLWQVHASLGTHPLGAATRRVIVIAAISTGAVPLASRLLLGNTVLALAVGIVAGGGVYVLLLGWHRKVIELDALASALRRR